MTNITSRPLSSDSGIEGDVGNMKDSEMGRFRMSKKGIRRECRKLLGLRRGKGHNKVQLPATGEEEGGENFMESSTLVSSTRVEELSYFSRLCETIEEEEIRSSGKWVMDGRVIFSRDEGEVAILETRRVENNLSWRIENNAERFLVHCVCVYLGVISFSEFNFALDKRGLIYILWDWNQAKPICHPEGSLSYSDHHRCLSHLNRLNDLLSRPLWLQTLTPYSSLQRTKVLLARG
jgi:hypothetical protein